MIVACFGGLSKGVLATHLDIKILDTVVGGFGVGSAPRAPRALLLLDAIKFV